MISEWFSSIKARILTTIKGWLNGVKSLTWMRLWAAIVLGILLYGIFSSFKIDGFIMVIIPLVYLLKLNVYSDKDSAVLIIPILVNIALWLPCYASYMFLRLILCIELIKLVILSFISIPFILFLTVMGTDDPNGSGLLAVVFFLGPISIIALLFYINIKMRSSLKQNNNKIYFHVNEKTEQDIYVPIKKLVIIFYALATIYTMYIWLG